ncbi:MAG: type II toxin-antitoxin system HipA family toxin [Lachnospiraceae bacterium]|nr:type II toxin-antitoxin system HipA family toxin [Lachnospiraceae bacterium]
MASALKSLKVKYNGRYVGTLAMMKNGMVAFSYDDSWLEEGFSISPFSLPLEKKVFVPSKTYFGGLFGIFADSLPDAWGRLLLDRLLLEKNMNRDITVLDRLALVGQSGMGALEYEPDYEVVDAGTILDLDYVAAECGKILKTEYSKDLDSIFKMAGSSGGARPKILTTIDDKSWIIKFASQFDTNDIGLQEYNYSICAKRCGIEMTETRLFQSNTCDGYFGTVRFDIGPRSRNIHIATVAALLEADFRSPCLDYNDLFKLTRILTRENKNDIENMFRRMCFNVLAHNRDDHAKNFSFMYDEKSDKWKLSPAYDLTYSNTYWGEHTTSVDGNGKNPESKELISVGVGAGIKKDRCESLIDEIRGKVEEDLYEYL